MNDKEKILSQLSAYLDAELPDDQAEAVAAAVEQDAQLAAELERLRKTRDLVQRLPRQAAGDDFVAQVLAKAERTHLVRAVAAHQASPWRWVRHLATAAMVLIAASLGISVVVTLWRLPNVDDEMTANGRGADRIASVDRPAAVTLAESTDKPHLAKGMGPVGDERNEERTRLADVQPREGEARFGKAGDVADKSRGKVDRSVAASDGLEQSARTNGAIRRVAGKVGDKAALAASGVVDAKMLGGRFERAVPPNARNVEIYTNDLPQTQLQVERALLSNQIEPVAARAEEGVREKEAVDASNFYQAKQSSPSQVQYVAFVTPQQEERLDKDLAGIRDGQVVSQSRLVAPSGDRGPTGRGYRESAEIDADQAGEELEAPDVEPRRAGRRLPGQTPTTMQLAERQETTTTLPASQRIAARLNAVVITLNYRALAVPPKAEASHAEAAPVEPSPPATGPANE